MVYDARYAMCLIYPAIVAAGVWFGGWTGWVSFLLGGTVYPLVDAIPFRAVGGSPVPSGRRAAPGHRLLVAYAVLEFALLAWALQTVSAGAYEAWELVGIGLSIGTMTGGIGIPAAHELIHSRSRRFRAVGLLLLAPVMYMHFRIEHVLGHHRWVATPVDPATARLGEGLWQFVARSVPRQFVSAYRIEERRRVNIRRGKSLNRVIAYVGIEVALLALISACFGWTGLALFTLQAITAVLFLEATNYIEHYGLQRRQVGDGRYEPVTIEHSWNTTSWFTNSLAFNLGLHSDHHAAAGKSFTDLRHQPGAPQLPAGYLTMLTIASVPPLWRRMMDPRVRAYRARHADEPAS